MELLEQITKKGLVIARINGLFNLAENYNVPDDDEKLKEFLKNQLLNLSRFSTLEHFFSQENLFIRAFVYTYGKGFEHAIAYIVGEPLERIAYNFDDCMTSNGLKAIPNTIRKIADEKIYIIREMFTEMFEASREKQRQLNAAGITFEDVMLQILNTAFFIGRRVAISVKLDSKMTISLNVETQDSLYDHTKYDKRYSI
ncbi:hypothetical protein [Flavobacterium sp. GSA192]|uniref:hypothetical protein n=1 Tax=Flavobacterium sp. GSA192 TaxID=2576304 RepID=UPI0011281AE2|nr:hypothetical protein [Flavobacterium sp. GSA192]